MLALYQPGFSEAFANGREESCGPLRRALREVRALPRLGILKGLVDEGRVADLAKVPSVRSVEKEREIKLPPPGSPVQ